MHLSPIMLKILLTQEQVFSLKTFHYLKLIHYVILLMKHTTNLYHVCNKEPSAQQTIVKDA